MIGEQPPPAAASHPLNIVPGARQHPAAGLTAVFLRGGGPLTEPSRYPSASAQWPCGEPQWALFQDSHAIWEAVFEHATRPARGMLHANVALVDGTWSSVSSFNLDLFSGNLNLESGVFSTSPALHTALSEQWDDDWASAQRY